MLDWMTSLSALQAQAVTYLVTVVVVAATIVAVAFIFQWRRLSQRQAELQAALQQAELEASLKQELLAHGLSPDEIKQVIEATSADVLE
jgi:hypothetical protein